MSGCASCGAEDELLFTCSHCGEQYCVTHQFPHHACERFTAVSDGADDVGFRFGDGTTIADGDESPTSSGSSASSTDGPEREATSVPGPRVEVARDAARETRPDRDGPPPGPDVRGMPWERGPGTVSDWMESQTYPTYLAKVGGLSLLLTSAYYAGLAAALYGYV